MKKAKKIVIATLTCALAAGALSIGLKDEKKATKQTKESIMRQLINQDNQFVVVEIEGDAIRFNDPVLEEQMKNIGIFIPPSQRRYFQDRPVVKLTDPQFLEAFEKYYIPANLHKGAYIWKEIKMPS